MRARLLVGWGRLRGALLVGLGLLLGSQGRAQPSPAASGLFVFTRPGRHKAHVPYLSPRNLIIISARLNGQGPYNFLLDTGVATSLLTNPQLADLLGLAHGAEYHMQGVGGADSGLRAYEASNVRVSLPGVAAATTTWLVLNNDVLDLSGYVGMPVQGIIGADLFRSFVVALHPEQHELVLIAPARYKAPRGRRWASLPLVFFHDKAYVTVGVQQLGATPSTAPLPLRLLIDTGAGHALSLETTADHRLRLPDHRLRTDLGRGLSGIVSGSLGRVAAVQLGRYQLPQVLTSFPDSTQVHERLSGTERARHGSLGYEVLKRFTTVIDYPHGQLLLRPTAALREPFEHDMCGLDLLATGPSYRQYLVLRVAPNSPAASVGIAEGEELVAINLIPTQFFSITDLNHMLHSQDGRVLLLLLRRANGELYSASVKLKRQI
ncbi:aspartyl protease family protein [Hymenobacter sp. BRD128]|uniref:aspartyl protease family protein n=1 Tax=Hymenobacter sp. BRD128 TaxID=2675878 RepID=UPI0015671253|nr:aspartyl protease family protein [Hymenobacter sp. BRD128]QKG55668.1 aspartyl protease family protein [Hymenobacter sp. BRD128]